MSTELPPRDSAAQVHFDKMLHWQRVFVLMVERAINRRLVHKDYGAGGVTFKEDMTMEVDGPIAAEWARLADARIEATRKLIVRWSDLHGKSE